jgi:hypothetical protein
MYCRVILILQTMAGLLSSSHILLGRAGGYVGHCALSRCYVFMRVFSGWSTRYKKQGCLRALYNLSSRRAQHSVLNISIYENNPYLF